MKNVFLDPINPLEFAKTGLRKLPKGRLDMTIEYQWSYEVTPEMIRWWFLGISILYTLDLYMIANLKKICN